MAIKYALYDPDTDNDGLQEAPRQFRRVEPGDVVFGRAGLYVAADTLPNFVGFVNRDGTPWVNP
ncbi:hypothetical protein FKN01_32070 [Streptomyces sp. 130]|uniref:hypothetical protein n=1 Tax=Streptomyces sp. 130 TaxID=2591006 RepID=UPI00117D2025|nr:hypothetical protein [Streptomyces sp. 130]TRV71177.1 hypothetical protein FKN01_32070 [Streptomyces sp. 130]